MIRSYRQFDIFLADEGIAKIEEQRLAEAASNANRETHYDAGLFHVGDIE